MRRLPFLLPVVALAIVLVPRWLDSPTHRVDVASSGPRYPTVGELVAASDLIVVGRITHVADGRVVTDPTEPGAGIRTQLAQLAVERVVKGAPTRALVLEEEAALLDGTAITVDGVAPSVAGQRGVYFLIGGDAESPYHALIGAQGRYVIAGESLVPAADDPVSRELAKGGLDALLRRVDRVGD